ncbi:MAG: hypothetical protein ACD_7C00114G0006 [uncultured bacterium]|nr:MAG: hypothetical protein ACD_7C00114G0006 [uncultured bacterium]
MNKNKLSKKEINDNLDILYSRRDFMDSARIKFGDSLDKYLLTFSTGSLYLSILFIKSSFNKIIFSDWLLLGWIAFVMSIWSSLLAIFFSVYAHDEQIKMIDDDIFKVGKGEIPISRGNNLNFWVKLFQLLSMLGFFIGIIFLSLFYFLNIM